MRPIMGRHLTIKGRVILQYQIEKYTNVSVLSLSEDLKANPSPIYRELMFSSTAPSHFTNVKCFKGS